MAVGTFPIINYPHWFSPPLTHLKNAIVYSDQTDVVEKLELARQLPPNRGRAMQIAAAAYHDRYLTAAAFRRRLDNIPNGGTLHMLIELPEVLSQVTPESVLFNSFTERLYGEPADVAIEATV